MDLYLINQPFRVVLYLQQIYMKLYEVIERSGQVDVIFKDLEKHSIRLP